MDEVVDVFDENGNKTNKTIFKNEAHLQGIWHAAIHILIINKDKSKVLLQKRCEQKTIYPNAWDVSVGGHISSGEDALTSAKRELQEELGLNPEDYQFELVEIIKEQLTYHDYLINEFMHTFVIYSDIDLSKIKVQPEEVSAVNWFTKEELYKLIQENKVVPHAKAYKILNDILK